MMEDRRILLEILPEEVWNQILDKIDQPDTLLNLSEASVLLKQLLEPKRNIYLFPQVVKILVTQNFLAEEDYKDILGLGLVCKGWKDVVRFQLETPRQAHFGEYLLDAVGDLAHATRLRLYQCDISELQERVTETESLLPQRQENNPFPVRFLEILEYRLLRTTSFRWYGYEGLKDYRTAAEHFLEIAGQHFWHAMIVAGFRKSPLEWCTIMCRYMELMPNLKSLQLCCPHFNDKHWCELNQLSTAPKFTALADLEGVSLEYVPTSVMNAILAANRHIKVLLIPSRPHSLSEEDPNQLLSLSCVQDVHTLSISFKSAPEFDRIPENWNLSVLRIEFVPESNSVDLSDIFRKLECFKETLKVLYLNLPKTTHQTEADSRWKCSLNPLQLPCLQKLEIKFCSYLSLDFLQSLQSLKYLYLRFNEDDCVLPACWDTSTDKIFFNWDATFHFFHDCIWESIATIKKVELIQGHRPTHKFKRI